MKQLGFDRTIFPIFQESDAIYCLFQCDEFVKVGAAHGLTPSDVIQGADITFSCVANPQAAKDVS